jgi:transposase
VAWRALTHDLPPWHAVYDQAQRWLRAGCFETRAHDLRALHELLLETLADLHLIAFVILMLRRAGDLVLIHNTL